MEEELKAALPVFLELRVLAIMIDFQGCNRPIAMAHFYKTGERENAFVAAESSLRSSSQASLMSTTELPNVDYGDAPWAIGRKKSTNSGVTLPWRSARLGDGGAISRRFFKDDAPDSNRFKYMLIT